MKWFFSRRCTGVAANRWVPCRRQGGHVEDGGPEFAARVAGLATLTKADEEGCRWRDSGCPRPARWHLAGRPSAGRTAARWRPRNALPCCPKFVGRAGCCPESSSSSPVLWPFQLRHPKPVRAAVRGRPCGSKSTTPSRGGSPGKATLCVVPFQPIDDFWGDKPSCHSQAGIGLVGGVPVQLGVDGASPHKVADDNGALAPGNGVRQAFSRRCPPPPWWCPRRQWRRCLAQRFWRYIKLKLKKYINASFKKN